MPDKKIRTRIAPSPTGLLHVGTARAALFNELYAKHNNGQFVIRIEDTDQERSEEKFEEDILTGLKWLELEWDEGPNKKGDNGPYRQSERTEKYQKALEKLIKEDKAYQEPGEEVIKFRVTETTVTFSDLIRGEVTINADSWGGDFIIARSIKDPLFHLAVVVDDAEMHISHVIRGEDHLSNTARHILLQKALGFDQPEYAHLPLLLDKDRKKLSKRAGDVSLLSYKDKGILPEAIINYLALLGWNPGDERELFTHKELIAEFNLKNVQKGGAIFDQEKLESINKQYLSKLGPDELLAWGKEYFEQDPKKYKPFLKMDAQLLLAALQTEQSRISSYYELHVLLDWARPDWTGEYENNALVWRNSTAEATIEYLKALHEVLSNINEDEFNEKFLANKLLSWIKEKEWKNGDVLWPMRVALTDREQSPGPFEVATAIGPETTLARIHQATKILSDSISEG
jgi:glutamyl-tRNA synthetase